MKKETFINETKNLSEKDILIETLYNQQQQLKKIEATRKNTSNLVWIVTILLAALLFYGFISYLSNLTAL